MRLTWILLATAAAGCAATPGDASGSGGKADGTDGSCAIDVARSLMIRDPAIVERLEARGDGAWSWGTVLRNMFPDGAAEDQWIAATGDGLCRLPASYGVSCTPSLPYHLLDARSVPAELIAIVDRVDLASATSAPEMRMVYQLPDRFFENSSDPLTHKFVNFEFDLQAVRDENGHAISPAQWAEKFAHLSKHAITSAAYRDELGAIIQLVTRRGAAPDRPNGSAIRRIQTSAEGWNYGFTIDEWDIVSLALDDSGKLVSNGLENVPSQNAPHAYSPGSTKDLPSMLIDHEDQILAGTYQLPAYKYDPFNPNPDVTRVNFELMVHWGSGGILSSLGQTLGYDTLALPSGWTPQRFEHVRSAFESQGCVGCHGVATATAGHQFMKKAPGAPVGMSPFLEHVELPRRLTHLRELTCSQSTPLPGEDNTRVVGCTRTLSCDSALPSALKLNEIRSTALLGGFIELAGPPNTPLDGYSILVDGNSLVLLDGYQLGNNGYFVVATDSTLKIADGAGSKQYAPRELFTGAHDVVLQHGTAIVDEAKLGTVADSWSSLGRSATSDDTDSASDFAELTATPGRANCACATD